MKKIINAKFNSTCAETGCRIKKGERMMYDYSERKAYAIGSKAAVSFINNESNSTADMVSAQEDAYFDNFCYNNNI